MYRTWWCFLAVSCVAASASVLAQRPTRPAAYPALELQVRLDRAGFSPGEIDGKNGSNTAKALAAYKHAHELALGTPDDAALGGAPGAGAVETLVPYTITAGDAAGPFITIPEDMMAKAKLKALGYSSLIEALGERFHSAPSLLLGLNPGARFIAGASIRVPNVAGAEEPAPVVSANAANIVVSKSRSSLTVFDADGKPIFYAPVTSGSEHDPLPLGNWIVTAVLRNPTFSYNPDLFWDADPARTKTQIPAGPNGPVGVVWIDLNKEHYGMHGTPEPSQVGHSSSHGCVRLTNWDATTLAGLVKRGTPVVFVE
jgi:lipoprotein-anchoring transpeptidase ErfK/SrfK